LLLHFRADDNGFRYSFLALPVLPLSICSFHCSWSLTRSGGGAICKFTGICNLYGRRIDEGIQNLFEEKTIKNSPKTLSKLSIFPFVSIIIFPPCPSLPDFHFDCSEVETMFVCFIFELKVVYGLNEVNTTAFTFLFIVCIFTSDGIWFVDV
jgi:hypothetical protein